MNTKCDANTCAFDEKNVVFVNHVCNMTKRDLPPKSHVSKFKIFKIAFYHRENLSETIM